MVEVILVCAVETLPYILVICGCIEDVTPPIYARVVGESVVPLTINPLVRVRLPVIDELPETIRLALIILTLPAVLPKILPMVALPVTAILALK